MIYVRVKKKEYQAMKAKAKIFDEMMLKFTMIKLMVGCGIPLDKMIKVLDLEK